MESLYHDTNKLLRHIQSSELAAYEQARGEERVGAVGASVSQQLDTVLSQCERLSVLVNKEPAVRRAQARYRVDQLRYDYQHLAAAAQGIAARHEGRRADDRQREELLTRRFARNSDAEHTIMMDHAMSEHSALSGSNRAVEEMLASGHSALASLRGQKAGLKGIRTKMLDMVNVLGMSNTVMRLIERRSRQDKVVMCVGMVLTLGAMFLLWRYFLK